jgi:hypothetical protein
MKGATAITHQINIVQLLQNVSTVQRGIVITKEKKLVKAQLNFPLFSPCNAVA